MVEYWKSQSANVKFSVIAFFVCGTLGLISMGALGAALYYPVSFILKRFPAFSDWHGDWVWPAVIMIGMFWSFGFLLGALAWHYTSKITTSKIALFGVYSFVLWLWAALLWYFTLSSQDTF